MFLLGCVAKLPFSAVYYCIGWCVVMVFAFCNKKQIKKQVILVEEYICTTDIQIVFAIFMALSSVHCSTNVVWCSMWNIGWLASLFDLLYTILFTKTSQQSEWYNETSCNTNQ